MRRSAMLLAACLADGQARGAIIDTTTEPGDIRILGEQIAAPGRLAGAGAWVVTGDFNADGLPDLATSGPSQWPRTVSIVLGLQAWPATIDFSTRPPDVIIREAASPGRESSLGYWPKRDPPQSFLVLGSGDVTGDGIDDLAISAPGWNPREIPWFDGLVVVVPGRTAWPAEIAVDPDTWSPAIVGPPVGGWLGASLHVSDLDGDGIADLALGAPFAPLAFGGVHGSGRVYVVHGPLADARLDTDAAGSLLDGTDGLDPNNRDASGLLGGVIDSGVLSPDVPAGLVFGQYAQHPSGRVLLLDGSRVEGRVTVRESPALVREILGPMDPFAFIDIIGQAVDLGDVDCSGWGDVVVNNHNAFRPDFSQARTGRVDLYRDVVREAALPARSLSIYGRARRVNPRSPVLMTTGVALADLNGDGFDDFVVFEPGSDGLPGSLENSGNVAIVWNRPDLPPEIDLDVDSEYQVLIGGPRESFNFGRPIRPADVDGDGRVDLIVGTITELRGGSQPDGTIDVFTRNLHVTTVTADAGPVLVIELNGGCDAQVTLDASASSDSGGNALRHRWYRAMALHAEGETTTLTLPVGEHCFRLFSTSDGGWAQDRVHVSVREATPPEIRAISVSPDSLWPPNHRMRSVHVTLEAWDECTAADQLTYELLSVTSSEPPDGLGDGRSMPDILGWNIGTADFDGELRAERSGPGGGRQYTLTYEVRDAAGNASTATLVVGLGHDRASPRARRIGR